MVRSDFRGHHRRIRRIRSLNSEFEGSQIRKKTETLKITRLTTRVARDTIGFLAVV